MKYVIKKGLISIISLDLNFLKTYKKDKIITFSVNEQKRIIAFVMKDIKPKI